MLVTTLRIEVPPLIERIEDVPLIAQHLVERHNRQNEANLTGLTERSITLLQTHHWPGNDAELARRVTSACARTRGTWVDWDDWPRPFRDAVEFGGAPEHRVEPIDLPQLLSQFEAEFLVRAYELADGNKAQAARLVGMPRARFLRRWDQLVERSE